MGFILTRELGRLAKWLRILGFDAEYFQGSDNSSLIIRASRDERIIITRSSRNARIRLARVALVESEKIKEQLKELMLKLNLKLDPARMFTRCIICNTELKSVDKQLVKKRAPEYIFNSQQNFFSCPSCQRIYWQGSHWGNVAKILKEIDAPR